MKILVTGGAGYIGSHTAPLLRDKGHEVFILDNFSQGRKEACGDLPVIEVDLNSEEAIRKVFQENSFGAVIHFAAKLLVADSMKRPDEYFKNNVGGTINLLNAMVKNRARLLVFSSSAAVYGNTEEIPIKEEAAKKPTSVYGATKLMMEEMLPWYEQAYGLKWVALRYFNACGADLGGKNGEAHKPETHIIPLLIRVALGAKESFSLYGDDYATPDGSCVRDYIHVLDLAEAHVGALEYLTGGGKSNAFNVGTGKGYSNKEVIEAVKKVTGKDLKVETAPRRPGDPAELVADNRKIREILRWEARHSDLETIVKSAYQWHKDNPFTLKD